MTYEFTDTQILEGLKNDIYYFWTERGDISRLSGLEEKMPFLEKHWPEFVKVYRDYKMATKLLDLVVRSEK